MRRAALARCEELPAGVRAETGSHDLGQTWVRGPARNRSSTESILLSRVLSWVSTLPTWVSRLVSPVSSPSTLLSSESALTASSPSRWCGAPGCPGWLTASCRSTAHRCRSGATCVRSRPGSSSRPQPYAGVSVKRETWRRSVDKSPASTRQPAGRAISRESHRPAARPARCSTPGRTSSSARSGPDGIVFTANRLPASISGQFGAGQSLCTGLHALGVSPQQPRSTTRRAPRSPSVEP